MKITAIIPKLYRIPLPVVLSDSTHGQVSHFEMITVRVQTDAGIEGLGYTFTTGTGGSSVHALLERDLHELLIGCDPRRIEQLWERMWWHVHFVGRGGPVVFAISAIDIALWDIKGKMAAEPWWRLLGGHENRVHAYAGDVDLYFTLDDLITQGERFLAAGFRAIKMKIGRPNLDEDLNRIACMRELLGELPLLVDANMGWRVDEAIRAARRLAEHDVFWLEEPTIPDDVEGHARIAREGGVPLATGENLHAIYEFEQMIDRGGISFPEPDVATCGGVTAWLKIAHLAEAHNLPVTSHGVHDLSVHLLAAVPNDSFLEVHMFGLERYMKHSLPINDGFAVAPDRPGHGVELNWEELEEHRTG